MAKRFRRCVLHIGTEKTGTSAIQQFLNRNRDAFVKEGVLYPNLGGGGSQWELMAIAHPDPWNDNGLAGQLGIVNAEKAAHFEDKLREELDLQFRSAEDCDTLIVSSEHFHSRLQEQASIARLKMFLDQWVEEYQIVVFFRRQDRVAISFNSTVVKSGAVNLAIRLPTKLGAIPRYYRYDLIFSEWVSVFGKSAVEAHIYKEGDRDLVMHFCNVAAIRFAGKLPPVYVNLSLDGEGLRILCRVNRFLEGVQLAEARAARQRAVQILTKRYPGKFYFLTRQQAQQFFSLFSEVNNDLQRAAFPYLKHPLFDDEFSEYPEILSDMSMDDQTIAEHAARILEEVTTKPISEKSGRIWRRLSDMLK
ncbi:MAG: hypothetical protein AAGI92_02730 [Pseudomonadota bacterium]